MNKEIILYSLTTCGFCKAIKKMFADLGLVYTTLDVDDLGEVEREEALKELMSVNKLCSFPTVVIGDQVVAGYKVQEIKNKIGIRTEVDELYDDLIKINEPKGYFFNNQIEKTFELLRGLLTNKDRHGYMACPCRLSSGKINRDRDIICPCKYRDADIKEFGSCYCGLYVTKKWNDGSIERFSVPERRRAFIK